MKISTYIDEWLLGQINERLSRRDLIAINQVRQENGSVKDISLNSSDIPEISYFLSNPDYSPFVSYSLLVQYYRQTGKSRPDKTSTPKKADKAFKPVVRNYIKEAWEQMEEDGRKTVESNKKLLQLLEKLDIEWGQSLYDRALLTQLSFVPEQVIDWGLKIMKTLEKGRAIRVRYIRRYSNPRTSLLDDCLVPDEIKHLSPEEQRLIMARSFRIIPKKSEKRILQAMGIDKKAGPLKQSIWRLILPPLFDYLIFLQGETSETGNKERAYREASLILNARYPHLWPHNPRRVKHFAV